MACLTNEYIVNLFCFRLKIVRYIIKGYKLLSNGSFMSKLKDNSCIIRVIDKIKLVIVNYFINRMF